MDPPFHPVPVVAACLQALARDFMVKTRRRKGMTDDVSVAACCGCCHCCCRQKWEPAAVQPACSSWC